LGALSLIRGDLCDQGRLLGGRLGVLLCRRGLIGDSRDFGGLFLRTLRRNLAAVDNRGASGSRVLGLGLLLLGLLQFSLLGRCLLGLIFCSLLGRSLFFGLLRRGLFLSFLLGSSFLCLLRLFGFCLLELFSLSLLGLLLSRLLRCSLLCGSFLGLLRFGLLGLFCLGLLSFSLFGSLGLFGLLGILRLFSLIGLLCPGLNPIGRGLLTLVSARCGRGGSFALGILDDRDRAGQLGNGNATFVEAATAPAAAAIRRGATAAGEQFRDRKLLTHRMFPSMST